MKVYELLVEWDNLTRERKKLAIDNVAAALKLEVDGDFHDGIIREILFLIDGYDENDYFGTEGLDV